MSIIKILPVDLSALPNPAASKYIIGLDLDERLKLKDSSGNIINIGSSDTLAGVLYNGNSTGIYDIVMGTSSKILSVDSNSYVQVLENSIKVLGVSGTFSGIVYNADYSGEYTLRSLVDKEYVDTTIDLQLASDNGNVTTNKLNFPQWQVGDIDGTNNIYLDNSLQVLVAASNPTFSGVVYDSDYSANFTLRSLVDKGYVDSAGLTYSGNTNSVAYFNTSGSLASSTFKVNANGLADGSSVNSIDINNRILYSSTGAKVFDYSSTVIGLSASNSITFNAAGTYVAQLTNGGILMQSASILAFGTYNSYIYASGDALFVNGWNHVVVQSANDVVVSAPNGAKYAADYSGNYTLRSLVDKGYVDSKKFISATHSLTASVADTITHNLNTKYINISLWDIATGDMINLFDANNRTSNTVDITVSVTGTYDVIISG
jgi:hypothetical protein